MIFQEKLKELMEDRHETKYRLAKEIGVTQTTIANWLNGVSMPQRFLVGKLEEHYGENLSVFFCKNSDGGGD